MQRGLSLVIFICSFVYATIPSKAQVIDQDSLALIEFYVSTSGGDWLIPWDTTQQVSQWFGVALNEDNDRVEGIALPNNQVSGQIPTSLSDLDKLTTLDLSDNLISGKIPNVLGNLDTLIILDLSGNLIADTIPEELGTLTYLKTLDLSKNELSGEIPFTLGNLDSLRILNLFQNELSGEVPSSFTNLDSLNILNLSVNNLSGLAPYLFNDLAELREYNLSSNQFSGSLPLLWNQNDKLQVLRLNDNEIDGTLSAGMGGLNSLFILNLSNNLLEGPIPSAVANLDSLRTLDLSGNLFDEIEFQISDLSNLESLDLSENKFNGPLPTFPVSPGNLEFFDLHDNLFSGEIPEEYGNINTLTELDLSQNNLSGTLPESFLNLLELQQLDLSDNQITTLIDISELGQTGNLQNFDVSGNQLGFDDLEFNIQLFNDSTDYSPQARINDTLNVAVPSGNIYTLLVEAEGSANQYRWVFESEDSLIQVDYQEENFEYSIENFQEDNSGAYTCEIINTIVPGLILRRNPINLFQAINTIDSLALIHFNSVTGGSNWTRKWNLISEPVFTWEGVELESGTVVGLDLEENNLQGFIPDSLGLLQNLRFLDLSGNNLTDTLPVGFSTLQSLEVLDLSNNRLTGNIPDAISGMDSLFRIDLSRNRFSGTITSQFDSLQFLIELNISDNDLTGVLPGNLNSLPLLEVLALGDNRLSGEIPLDFGTLENLRVLDLSENRLNGSIPEEIAFLPNLEELKLFRNQLSGALPESFKNSTSIERLFINDNRLTTLPTFSTSQFEYLELRVFNNILSFDDIIDNFNGFNNAIREDEFLFLPQPTIIDLGTQTLQENDSIIIEIPDDHPDNRYRWLKEGTETGVETREFSVDSAQISSSGIYRGQVWTSNANFIEGFNTPTDSLLFSFAYTILVLPPTPDVKDPEPFCIGNDKVTLRNEFGGQSGLVSRWYVIHPNNGGNAISGNSVFTHQINNESDTLFVTNGLAINNAFETDADTVVIISRPWILEREEFLEVAPSDSLLNSRFGGSVSSSYQWFVNGDLAIGETGPTIQKFAESRYHVRVVRKGCSSTSLEYLPKGSNLILGVSEDFKPKVTVFPNPIKDYISIKGLQDENGPLNILILDLSGKTVESKIIGDRLNGSNVTLDLSKLKPGLYLLKANSKREHFSFRFVKE